MLGLIGYYIQQPPRPPASVRLNFPEAARTNDLIEVPLEISTSVAMNAAEFYFNFPADLLEVETIDRGGSFFDLWITDPPTFDNTTGLMSFAGGLPKPGYVGKNGLVAKIRFRAKKPGSGQITLELEKTRILANDGLGTKIDASFTPISFTID